MHSQTVPISFSEPSEPGPIIPDTATATSQLVLVSSPEHISSTTCSETAPYFPIVLSETDNNLIFEELE